MVSMKEIAKQCNVSVATVSKALNGYSDIRRRNKKLHIKTASEMGYLPNSSARALKTKRTFNMGVLFVDEAEAGSHMITLTEYWKALRGPQKRKAMTLPYKRKCFR